MSDIIGAIISLVLIITILACGHYLQQIRDCLREMRETQKKLAKRLGA